jgi:hypothetical protein
MLFWPSLASKPFGITSGHSLMYCARFGRLLRGELEIFLSRKKPRQRSIHPDRARRKTVFVFFVAFCQSHLAKSLRRDPKANPPADFSPAGGNLFNVSALI